MDLGAPSGLLTVVAAQAGDRAALDRVLRALQGPLFEHIRYVVGEHADAEDVLQETLISVASGISRLRDPRLARAWATRIAHRAAVRHARRRARGSGNETSLPDDLPDHAPGPDVEALGAADRERLRELLPALPPACGAAVRLRYLDELALAEVAEVLDVPVGTVKSRVSYGLALLRERMAR